MLFLYAQNVTEGKQSPSWATADVMAKLAILNDYTLGLFFSSKAKNRLTAGKRAFALVVMVTTIPSGVWLGKVLGDMQSKANNSDAISKLFLYSAVSLLEALQIIISTYFVY